ncbi:MAG: hypothetical protein L0922_05715, partial [Candidatus Mariimomonas ferrooxydans]
MTSDERRDKKSLNTSVISPFCPKEPSSVETTALIPIAFSSLIHNASSLFFAPRKKTGFLSAIFSARANSGATPATPHYLNHHS